MYIKEKEGELVITERPGCLWIAGLFFAIMGGIVVWGTVGGFGNWNESETWHLVVGFSIGSIVLTAGCFMIFRAPITKIFINRYTNTVTHQTRGVLGKEEKIYRFDEVKQFFLTEHEDSDSGVSWYLNMELQNGETKTLTIVGNKTEVKSRDIVFQTNEFMQKQMPSYENNLKLDE